jgi:hypothetical protein
VTDDFCEFSLIDSRFAGMSIKEKDCFIKDIQKFVNEFQVDALQGKVDLANQIETIVTNAGRSFASKIKKIRENREIVRIDSHKDFIKEASNG